ncbi:MAG: hypothetical protein IJ514_07410 [Clostridia bacterium]|nr:hypothetical protein [Clostridia bacterium]
MNGLLDEIQYCFMERNPVPREETLAYKEGKAREALEKTLSDEQRKLFEAYTEAHFAEDSYYEEKVYEFAFTSAVKLVLECVGYSMK